MNLAVHERRLATALRSASYWLTLGHRQRAFDCLWRAMGPSAPKAAQMTRREAALMRLEVGE